MKSFVCHQLEIWRMFCGRINISVIYPFILIHFKKFADIIIWIKNVSLISILKTL